MQLITIKGIRFLSSSAHMFIHILRAAAIVRLIRFIQAPKVKGSIIIIFRFCMEKKEARFFFSTFKIANKSCQQIIVDFSKLLVKMAICTRVLSKLVVYSKLIPFGDCAVVANKFLSWSRKKSRLTKKNGDKAWSEPVLWFIFRTQRALLAKRNGSNCILMS